MQKRLLIGPDIEIAGFPPELEIRRETCGRQQAFRISHQIGGKQQEVRGDRCDGEHGEQRRKYATDPALVELRERETTVRHLSPNERGDEVPGDDEKNVDPHKAPAKK